MKRLKTDHAIREAEPIPNAAPFWSPAEQKIADKCSKEADLVTFVTPFFNDVLAKSYMVFVKSEKDKWLPQGPGLSDSVKLHPDGFAAHRGMYHPKGWHGDGIYGIPHEELFDSVILFECKLRITNAALGQVRYYLQCLDTYYSASAILFDRARFYGN